MNPRPKIVLTGIPGVGKTALIKRVLEKLKDVKKTGFITEEQSGKKGRGGVLLKALDGREAMIARMGKGKGARVGKYIVNVETFEELAIDLIAFKADVMFYVIDEIGPMQALSRTFCETAKMLLKSDRVVVLASVTKTGHGFIREVKRLPGVETFELTEENQGQVEDDIIVRLVTAFAQEAQPEPVPEQT